MSKIELSLNDEWRFNSFAGEWAKKLEPYREDFSLENWFKGNVPGSVQGDLFSLGRLPDPLFNQNAEHYRFIEEKEWWYAKEFILPESFQDKELYLRFEGIDTISTIYLNGQRIGETQNMFTPYEFRVTGLLTPGKNRLFVKLKPIVTAGLEKKKKEKWFQTIAGDEYLRKTAAKNILKVLGYIRKANFAYGGDMSQRFLTVGIWRPVKIIGYQKARILNTQVITSLKDKKKRAAMSLSVEIEKFSPKELVLILKIKITQKNNHIINKRFPLTLKGKKQNWKISFDISNPRLWWPNGTGEQNLYNLNIELTDKGDHSLDTSEERFGIREV